MQTNQVLAWKKHLISEVGELFRRGSGLNSDSQRQIKKLQTKVDKFHMEIDFLSSAIANNRQEKRADEDTR